MTVTPPTRTVAEIADTETRDFVMAMLEGIPPEARGEATTGALYALLRVMHAIRPRDVHPGRWAFSVLTSCTAALAQLDPTPELAAAMAGDDAEGAFLQMVGDTANTMTQHLADTLHERFAAAGPCCPMSGIVPGMIAGATYAAAENRDRAQAPEVDDIRPFIDGVVTAALEEAKVYETADAMGEAMGHG